MSPRQVVIGSGPDALRAAAALARAGHSVHLIQQAECASGLRHPDLPLGTGLIHVAPEHRALTEAVLGPLVEGPDPSRSVVINNEVESLPVGIRGLHRMLPGSVLRGVGKSLMRARGRNLMAEIIGGGMEERSHRDWVTRRMGEPAWHHLYQSYALRRWGLHSHELAASVARVHHGAVEEGAVQVVGGSYSQALENAERCLADAGGTLETGKCVEKLELRDGQVRVIHLEDGKSIEVDGRVWVCEAPARVAEWLGDAVPKGIRVHASRCRQFPVVRVGLRGETRDLPTELHVLDERASF